MSTRSSMSNSSHSSDCSPPATDYVPLFSVLAWDISKRSLKKDSADNGVNQNADKDDDVIQRVRMETMKSSIGAMPEIPQLYLMCNVASAAEVDDIAAVAGLDQPGWICSNSLINRPSASTIMWTTAIDCGFHVKTSYGSRRMPRDRSVQEMFSIETILLAVNAGSDEAKCVMGNMDARLDPKRTCFSIMNIWLESSCMEVMTAVYCCSPRTHPYRRADVLRRFLFMARQAAKEHTKGNLILFVSPGMARQRCHFDEILQTIASVDLNMAEECYISDGGCFVTFQSPLGSFRLDDIRTVDMGLAVRKNLLKAKLEVPFEDDELHDYFDKQPMFFSLSVRKHVLFNEETKRAPPSPEKLVKRLDDLFLEKARLDALGCPQSDIPLNPIHATRHLHMITTQEQIRDAFSPADGTPHRSATDWPNGKPVSITTWPAGIHPQVHSDLSSTKHVDSFHETSKESNPSSRHTNMMFGKLPKTHNLNAGRISPISPFDAMDRNAARNRASRRFSAVTHAEGNASSRLEHTLSGSGENRGGRRRPNETTAPSTAGNTEKRSKLEVGKRSSLNNQRNGATKSPETSVPSDALRADAAHVVRRLHLSVPSRTVTLSTPSVFSTNHKDENNNKNLAESPKGELEQLTSGRGRIVRISTGGMPKTAILKGRPSGEGGNEAVGVHIVNAAKA